MRSVIVMLMVRFNTSVSSRDIRPRAGFRPGQCRLCKLPRALECLKSKLSVALSTIMILRTIKVAFATGTILLLIAAADWRIAAYAQEVTFVANLPNKLGALWKVLQDPQQWPTAEITLESLGDKG